MSGPMSWLEPKCIFCLAAIVTSMGACSGKSGDDRASMQTIGAAAHQWQTYFGDAVCPSVRQLEERRLLDPEIRKLDRWDQSYAISCKDTEVVVTSAGSDKKFGTPDDIVVSASRRK